MKPTPIILDRSIVLVTDLETVVRFLDMPDGPYAHGSRLEVTQEMAFRYGYYGVRLLQREFPLYLEWMAEALGNTSLMLRALALGGECPLSVKWEEEQRALSFAAFVNSQEIRDELMDSLIPLEDAGHRLGDLRVRALELRASLEAKWGCD